MKHRIVLGEDNIIRILIDGDVSTKDVFEIGRQVFTCIDLVGDKKLNARLLLDYAKAGDMGDETCLNATATVYRSLDDNAKLALVSTNEQYTQENFEAVKLAKKEHIYRVFHTNKEAEAWLRE